MSKRVVDIEQSYLNYLKNVNLDLDKIPKIQFVELRRAFYGAYGSFILQLENELSNIENEDEAMEALTDVERQVVEFFSRGG